MNQVGVHTGTLIGTLGTYTSIQRTVTFLITVINPCPTTKIIWVASPTTINCTVGQLSTNGVDPYYTQKTVSVIDHVSESQSTTGICGLIEMSISSVPTSGNSALTDTELILNQGNGTISVWTSNDATFGNHTVTVSAWL